MLVNTTFIVWGTDTSWTLIGQDNLLNQWNKPYILRTTTIAVYCLVVISGQLTRLLYRPSCSCQIYFKNENDHTKGMNQLTSHWWYKLFGRDINCDTMTLSIWIKFDWRKRMPGLRIELCIWTLNHLFHTVFSSNYFIIGLKGAFQRRLSITIIILCCDSWSRSSIKSEVCWCHHLWLIHHDGLDGDWFFSIDVRTLGGTIVANKLIRCLTD
jgi:hypothetical protein